MPRSAADATRFTATVPHASSKAASSMTINRPPTSTETPQQKVARLRAAANRAKAGNVATFDKVVVRGRVWVDRLHRAFTLGLVGLTGIAFIYAAVATTDMILYNRRKKAEYFSSQAALLQTSIADAAAAEALGTATEEQLALLERERAHAAQKAELAAQKEPGILQRIKTAAFKDLKKEEGEPSPAGIEAGMAEEDGSEGVLAQVKAIHAGREAEERERREADKLGERPGSSEPEREGSKSWTRWLSIRR